MAQAAKGGGGIHQVGGCDPPQSVCDATALWVQEYAPKGGRPTKRGHEVVGRSRARLSVPPDRALKAANKRGEELEAVRGDLKEAQEGRQKAEVEAAQLRVEVEALRRTRDLLQQRVGVGEAHVRSLTSTLNATYTAQQGVGPLGVQGQGSGRSGSQ